MDEQAWLEKRRIELSERLDAVTQLPQHTLEYWLNENDIYFLKSLNVILDSDGTR